MTTGCCGYVHPNAATEIKNWVPDRPSDPNHATVHVRSFVAQAFAKAKQAAPFGMAPALLRSDGHAAVGCGQPDTELCPAFGPVARGDEAPCPLDQRLRD